MALLFYLCMGSSMVLAQENTNPRARWFVDARFGMFIHWGVYSGAEGYWKGEKLRYDNDYAEWIQYRNRIDKSEYLTLLDRFDWEEIDPEEWVILAREAGMQYVTITAKHHDGFALWDSEVGTYDLGDHTSPKRDIIMELANACRKHGLKLGLYYSHWVDWEHPYGWDHTREIYGLRPKDFDVYWQEKVIPQMRELLTNYGPIGMLWFDMWIHHSETVVSKEQLLQLKKLIRDLQPDCLVNSRLGLSVQEDPDVDFQTLGDNQFGNTKLDHPWQSPATVAHSWGYHAGDSRWKSTTTLLQSLISNVSLNGNMMLNIGPRANGDVPAEIVQRLKAMGQWLAVNGSSVYGSGAFDLRQDLHDWGLITYKQAASNEHNLFLHIANWPLSKQLRLTGIKTPPGRIYLLADKQKSNLDFTHTEVVTDIRLPKLAPDPFVSVVVVEYDQTPVVDAELVARTQSGGFALTPRNSYESGGNIVVEHASRFGSVPEHIVVKEDSKYKWKIFVDKPCVADVDVSYSCQSEKASGSIRILAANQVLSDEVKYTGQTVGEPGQQWVIDNYHAQDMGRLEFNEAGYYEIEVEIIPDKEKPLNFQWLWLQVK